MVHRTVRPLPHWQCRKLLWLPLRLLLVLVTAVHPWKERCCTATEESNAPHNRDPERSSRFPSVDERIKLYLGNWYSPPCEENVNAYVRYDFAYHDHALLPSACSTQKPNVTLQEIHGNWTTEISPEVKFDILFYLDRDEIMTCAKNGTTQSYRFYCRDIHDIVLPALDRLSWNGNHPPNGTPIVIQVGDQDTDKRRGYIEVPMIKKFRYSMSKKELQRITSETCVAGRRKVPWTRRVGIGLEPIIIKLNSERHFDWKKLGTAKRDVPWAAKRPVALFRGTLTGWYDHNGYEEDDTDYVNCMRLPRCRLVFYYGNSSLVDAKLTMVQDYWDFYDTGVLDGVKLLGSYLAVQDQLQAKALIMLEGNDVSSGLKWALYSNSVVMMPRPHFTSWAMEELLEPWVHYIPLDENLLDVEEKVEWMIENDAEAQEIAQRGRLWIEDLLFHPDSENDEKVIVDEILRRYKAHFRQFT